MYLFHFTTKKYIFQIVILNKYCSFRSFANEHKTQLSEGFIDGDLVEKFLDLKQSQMEDICKGIKVGLLVLV